MWWALAGGPLREALSVKHMWAQRKQVIDTLDAMAEIPLGEQGLEAAHARVRIAFVEMMKLQREVMSTPVRCLETPELMRSVDWMMEAVQGLESRRAASLDWTKLEPEEREIMLQAKSIQDRLMGGSS